MFISGEGERIIMSEVKRSHPPALRNTVKKTLSKLPTIKNSHIILGVSGGSDSMALLHVMSTLRNDFNFRLTVVGVNHNLRIEASSELDLVEDFCKKLNVDFYRKDIYLNGSNNIQSRARDERYKAIRKVKEELGADFIATAHHSNDRAETVLIRILRGTSVKGLSVLEPLNGELLRPMIYAKKRDVMIHIERKKIQYAEDPSNKKVEKYLRSKIRYEILPELEKINPNVIDSLCELAESAKYPEITGLRNERRKALNLLNN
jgi:tRNA(Ile)-lysidine synthase